jgi:hypothetical protein
MHLLKRYLLLPVCLCLAVALPCRSQTMTNNGNTTTLTNTCLMPGSYSYTMTLNYADPDIGFVGPFTFPVTVVSNGVTAVITLVSGSLPWIGGNGFWGLAETDFGNMQLTGAAQGGYMNWYHDEFGNIRFNCTALPIYFSNFHGSESNGTITLTWQTQTEQNSTYIEVYRSANGGDFYKIGQVPAAGNSNSILNYSFADAHPGSLSYYRLRLLNNGGSTPITSQIVGVSCQGCVYTPPTPVYCPYTINGPDQICNVAQITAYSLSTPVPNFNTINWGVDNNYAVKLTTYPFYDRSRVTLMKKNSAGGVTLTATLSGCSNVISKFIVVGTPPPTINAYLGCPYLYASVVNAPGATSFSWFLTNETQGTTTTSPFSAYAWDPFVGTGDVYDIGMSYTNVCGTSGAAVSYGHYCPPSGGGPGHDPWDPAPPDVPQPGDFQMSPNPSKGIINIGLAPLSAVSALKPAKTVTAKVQVKLYRVKVLDVQGVLRKEFSYPGGIDRGSLDLSSLGNGVYIIQLYDNKHWTSQKVIIAK